MSDMNIADIKALNGKIFAVLTPDEIETLNYFRDRGRKFGVLVSVRNEANTEELADASTMKETAHILRQSNSRISVRVESNF